MAYSIEDIAKKAQVSTTTVSRALNDRGYVSEEIKQRILKVAEEMNYTPKKYKKRHTATSVSNIIGVIVPDIRNSYFTGIIRGIENVVSSKGYDLFICDTQEDPGKEVQCISALHNCKACGLIIAVASDAVEYNVEYLKNLNDSGTPVVLIDRDLRIPGIDGIVMDNFRGAKTAVNALIANGHTEIAILSGPTTSRTGVDRLNGYLGALKENGIPIREEYIGYGDFQPQSGYKLTKKLLSSHRRVTAIFSANQRMTLGCLQAISDAGLTVPDDISVLSFGISDSLAALGTKISHVYQPTPPLGEESARVLLSKIEMGKKYKKIPSKHTVFSSDCLLRGSEKYPANRKERL